MKGLAGSQMKAGQGLYRCGSSDGGGQGRKESTEYAEQEVYGGDDDG